MNQKLVAARKAHNLTQKEVANRANISTRQYQYIEAGERKPNVETAISIARILGAKVEDLFATQTAKAAPMDGQTQTDK
jgi:DNA-binding XRE family transcriptional regulator